MQNQIQRLLYLLKNERESLQQRVTSLVSSCECLAVPDKVPPTIKSHRTCTSPRKSSHFVTPSSNRTASSSQPVQRIGHGNLTLEESIRAVSHSKVQASVGSDLEKQLIEETAALKQIAAQLDGLHQAWLAGKEKLELQNQLEQTKGTLRRLCRENTKLNAAVKVAETERESLKKKNAELAISLEESKQKYRKVRVTVLATKSQSAIEKRKQEALEQVKQEAGHVHRDKVKPFPDRTHSLKATISKKDEIIASYLMELTKLQVEQIKFTEAIRDMQQTLKEREWQISDLQSQLDATHADNTKLARGNGELAAKLQQLQSRYLDTTGCLEVSLTKTETQLSQTSKALCDNRKDFERQLNVFAQEKSELTIALTHAIQSNQQKSHEIAGLGQKINHLKSELSRERMHTRRMVEASAVHCQELAQRACLLELKQSILLN